MANEYLKPQTPLKDLNSENYFYPLTTHDQIIVTQSRLSAFMNESDNNLLDLTNIGTISSAGKFNLNGDLEIPNNHSFIGILGSNPSTNYTNVGGLTWFNLNGTAGAAANVNDTPTSAWWYIIRNRHTNTENNYYTDLAIPFNSPSIYYKRVTGNYGSESIQGNRWIKVLDDDNYSSTLDTRYVTLSTTQTISGQKTFTSLLKINTNGNTVTIGSVNTSYCHFESSANIPFYFNRQIQVNGNYKIYNNNTTYNAGWIELSGGTPFIDFHFNNSTADYTSRIIENASGRLYIPGKLAIGYTNDSYSLATASFICNSWIRTVGNTGWYNESYGGGWYMIDSTFIRNYGSKQVYINARLGVDAELRLWNNTRQITRDARSVSWVKGRDSALLRVSNFNGYSAVWSAKTTNGDWCCGPYNDNILYWSYATDANYNANNNSVVQMRLTPAGYLYAARIYTAVWNDYGEYRQSTENKPGTCVQENDNGILSKTDKRLIPGAAIVSDTYGYAQGKTEKAKTPIAVSGRVLAYTYQDRKNYHAGMSVCSAPNGTIDIMTREEIQKYPDAIIGIVSEIPEYKTWGTDDKVLIDNRIWIKVRY